MTLHSFSLSLASTSVAPYPTTLLYLSPLPSLSPISSTFSSPISSLYYTTIHITISPLLDQRTLSRPLLRKRSHRTDRAGGPASAASRGRRPRREPRPVACRACKARHPPGGGQRWGHGLGPARPRPDPGARRTASVGATRREGESRDGAGRGLRCPERAGRVRPARQDNGEGFALPAREPAPGPCSRPRLAPTLRREARKNACVVSCLFLIARSRTVPGTGTTASGPRRVRELPGVNVPVLMFPFPYVSGTLTVTKKSPYPTVFVIVRDYTLPYDPLL